MTPLLSEYFDLIETYQKEFKDEEVLLLMQVGSFYEAYEIDDPPRGCAKIISTILRMHLTKKNGNKSAGDNNPWMVGFPTYVLGKHLARLNDEGYTVVVYDQDGEAGRKQSRILKGIYNHIIRFENEDEIINPLDRRLFGISLEHYRVGARVKKRRFLLSMAYVDMSSGEIYVYENDLDDYQRELQNLILNYSPPEILFRTIGFEEEDCAIIETTIHNLKKLGTNIIVDDQDYTSNLRIGLLQELYETHSDPVVFLGLERHASILNVLVMVLLYIKKHDPLLATKLQRPQFIKGVGSHMEFNRDAFLELNIASICDKRKSYVEMGKQKSLIDIMSKDMSGLGRRVLEGIVRRPIFDRDLIRDRLEKIDYFMANGKEQTRYRIPDLEWLLLKWKRDKLSFRLTGQFLRSIFEMVDQCKEFFMDYYPNFNRFCQVREEIETTMDIDKMVAEDIGFIKKNHPTMDEFESKRKELLDIFACIEDEFKDYFKLQYHAETGYFLSGTIKKWESYQFKFEKNKLYEIHKNKTHVRLSYETLDKSSMIFQALSHEKEKYILETFRCLSKEILSNYKTDLEDVIVKIGELDCFSHLASFFQKYDYCRPCLQDDMPSDNIQISVKELRHPIYEYIERDQLFVPYTFELGDKNLGMLLYGMNSSGKSTLLKSLGSAIWLAQCGLHVPAKEFRHTNVHSLFTKIGAYDNLFCGHSTFVAEMSELNYILQKSDKRSIVLCDELTSGTETKSATGIVASSLLHFVKEKILFLFTTHLHTVAQIPEIRDHPSIAIKHFKVIPGQFQSFLIEDITIRYDRALYDGPGDDIYGIEIAKSLGLPKDFIGRAFDFRERVDIIIHDNLLQYPTSRYNKKLIVSECQQCGSRNNLHTHHITPQKKFQSTGIVHNKDGLFNLVALCEKCHRDVHHAPSLK